MNLIKKIFSLLIGIMLCNFMSAQVGFEYERTWGTYFGPAGSQIAGSEVRRGIIFDSQKNMYLRGGIWHNATYANSYYDQFLLGGGENYQGSQSTYFNAKFSDSGVPDLFGYGAPESAVGYRSLEAIDSQDNRYYIVYGGSPSLQATPGAFLSTDPQPSSSKKVLLAKYSTTGQLLWASYLPFVTPGTDLVLDSSDNIYVSGATTVSANLTTNGVWQENFETLYNSQGNLIPTHYLVKLDSNGQRVWGSYLPGGCSSMKYWNGYLYMITGRNINPNTDTMATSGAYQTVKSETSITKLDANTGTREWGTYYGPPQSSFIISIPTDLEVNATGIYITGTDYDDTGLNFYGTPTSHKSVITGGSDLFLSKFSHAGIREWSTYFGNSGSDMNEFEKVLAVQGSDIYISGNTYGSGNNIATIGSYQSAPELNTPNSINYYFAKFSASGNLIWCSYYGGTSSYPGILMPLNIAIDNNVLFLYGNTNSETGYTSESAWMPQRNPSNTSQTTAFIARFDLKSAMGVSGNESLKELVLYNNPNNGNFTLSGSVLAKEAAVMSLYDTSGRLVKKEELSRQQKQDFSWGHLLTSGNYILSVSKKFGEQLKTFKMTVKK
ncbi:T9SS type A sorting domain-containing protein [Kaistella sp. PBT33-4]|uniref:T9SS type A sorting domain-containing protein n=1 Tax=Kaistella sp. PBT33-4 TaxID=3032000 RepID=UPI0023D86727|nr:T9SS type A sorting domain-containing protein [Kaistella sp. PBT33-4]MDF0718431.1 T9SS type A sorting domain-containing protein [Kaistella sp. PBT33-4]